MPDAPPRQSDWSNLRRVPRSVWIGIVLFIAFWAALLLWRIGDLAGLFTPKLIGDTEHVESYGFDLDICLIPRDQIVPTVARDAIPALVDPDHMPGSEVLTFNEEHRGKFLVTADRVIGVVINGEARAYPIRILNWHEVANDTLGGVPIAVTYHPLCDSVVVFDRRIGERIIEFGVSGLLYNSNHLLYDHQPDEGGATPGLWSQLLFKAVTGPAAERGETLTVLPARLTTWGQWLESHPQTTVMTGLSEFKKRYARNPYGMYFARQKVDYPVVPIERGEPTEQGGEPAAGSDESADRGEVAKSPGLGPFDSVVAIHWPTWGWIAAGPVERLTDVDIRKLAIAGQLTTSSLTQSSLPELLGQHVDMAVVVEASAADGGLPTVYSLWFAWAAMHGDDGNVMTIEGDAKLTDPMTAD